MRSSIAGYIDTSSLLHALTGLHWFIFMPLITLYSKVSQALSRKPTPPPKSPTEMPELKGLLYPDRGLIQLISSSASLNNDLVYPCEDEDHSSSSSSRCMTPTSTETRPEAEAAVATGLSNVVIKDWTESITLTPIDNHGAVVLIVGTEAQATGIKNLRVSPKALCRASPVFSAMLAPYHSAELDEFPSKTVSLPDDDPLAMEIVCDIIHQKKLFQHLYIEDVSLMLRIALICEKYDTFLPLGGYLHVWCAKKRSEIHESLTCADSLRLLSVAYVLKNHDFFTDCSSEIIRRFFKQEMETAVQHIDREFTPPRTVIGRMGLIQRRSLLEFQKAVHEVIRTEMKAGGSCFENRKAKHDANPNAHPKPSTCIRAIRIGHFLSVADHSGIWCLEKCTLSPKALRAKFHQLIWSSPGEYGISCGCTLTDLTTGLTTAHRNYQQVTKGLCLCCILKGEQNYCKEWREAALGE